MKWWSNRGLRFKIALIITVTLLFVLGGIFYGVITYIRAQLWLREAQVAETLNSIAATMLEDAMMDGRRDLVQAALEKVGENSGGRIDDIAVFDDEVKLTSFASGFSGGRTIHKESLVEDISDPTCWVCHKLAPEDRPEMVVVNLDGQDVMRNVVPLYNESRCQTCHGTGKAVLGDAIVDLRLDRFNKISSTITLGLSGAAVIALILVGWVLFFFLNRLVLSPLGELESVTQGVVAGDLNKQATVRSGDEVGRLAKAFNTMTAQIRRLVGSLEQQVKDRTQALETSTEVSRRLSTILDRDELVKEVVEQVQSAFGYYHAHIYLYDEGNEYLVMEGGTGEAGQIMLDRGHRIIKGRGLVGRAGDTNLPILVADVSQEDGWLPNPLLPETKAELAVPIAAGERVIGVLDVQGDETGSLDQSDVDLLISVANQVAIALQNSELYIATQKQAEVETRVNIIGQRLQSATSIEDLLQIAVRELSQTLDAERISIQIGDITDNS